MAMNTVAYPPELPRPTLRVYDGPLYAWIHAYLPGVTAPIPSETDKVGDASFSEQQLPFDSQYLDDFGTFPDPQAYSYTCTYTLVPYRYDRHVAPPAAIPVRISFNRPIRIMDETCFDFYPTYAFRDEYNKNWRDRLTTEWQIDLEMAESDDILFCHALRPKQFAQAISRVELLSQCWYGWATMDDEHPPDLSAKFDRALGFQQLLLAGKTQLPHVPVVGTINLPHQEFANALTYQHLLSTKYAAPEPDRQAWPEALGGLLRSRILD